MSWPCCRRSHPLVKSHGEPPRAVEKYYPVLGDMVRIVGLTKAAHYNGEVGAVRGLADTPNRWSVEFNDKAKWAHKPGEGFIQVKAENLELIADAATYAVNSELLGSLAAPTLEHVKLLEHIEAVAVRHGGIMAVASQGVELKFQAALESVDMAELQTALGEGLELLRRPPAYHAEELAAKVAELVGRANRDGVGRCFPTLSRTRRPGELAAIGNPQPESPFAWRPLPDGSVILETWKREGGFFASSVDEMASEGIKKEPYYKFILQYDYPPELFLGLSAGLARAARGDPHLLARWCASGMGPSSNWLFIVAELLASHKLST